MRAASVGTALALALLARPAAAQELRLARVPVASPAGVDSLAALGFEVADLVREPGGLAAVVVVSDETAARLGAAGFRPSPIAVPAAPAAYAVYRDFDDPGRGVRAMVQAFAASHANVFLDSIGASIEGRPILAVKIGLAGDAAGRPNVLFLGTHHAREWISTEMAIALVEYLADSLAATPDSSLLRTRDIWVVPVVNPDGYQYTFTAGHRLWRKNKRSNGDGTVGVDLNRNYPGFWGYDDRGSSSLPGAEVYRGTGPASEPEVQAVVAFHAAHPPRVAVSYHSYSDLVIYPYGFQYGRIAPDLAIFRALAGSGLAPSVLDRVPESTRAAYHSGSSWGLYTTNGEYTDWAYRAHGTLAFTVELTAGCCAAGAYYGFEFPDDSAQVRQVVRDNLPLALAVLRAAGSPATASGPSGLTPSGPRLEVAWPDAWVDVIGSSPAVLTTRPASGAAQTSGFRQDSLDRGAFRNRAAALAPSLFVAPRAVRVEGRGWEAEALLFAGAEDGEAAWSGWQRTQDPVAGGYAWTAATDDTLTSPAVDLSGRTAVWLQFWTKHNGSLFIPDWQGRVQYSGDSGRTWTDVAVIEGSAPVWYPIRVDLPQAAGAPWASVRFITHGFQWWVDAVGLMTDQTTLFAQLGAVSDLGVSENPVRSGGVVIYWPASTADARLSILTFRGDRIHSATVPAGVTEYDWDLRVNGRVVANGAYVVVVQAGGQTYRRRLFVARR